MQRDHERATASLVSPRLRPWRTTERMRSRWASTLSDTRLIVSPLPRRRVTRCLHAGRAMILTRDPEGSSPLRSAGIVAWPNANVEVRVGDLWDVIDPAPRL